MAGDPTARDPVTRDPVTEDPERRQRPPTAEARTPQRWGIVGLGAQAEAIALAIGSVPGVRLAGCASGDGQRAAAFGQRFDCVAHRDDADLVDAGYDVVVVSSANDRHAEQSVVALSAGSAVLCEKPMALTVADATKVVVAARAARRPVFVGYHLRFLTIAHEVRAIVHDGALGSIRDVAMQRYSAQQTASVRPWRQDLARAGAGVLCDVAVHLFDTVEWVTGSRIRSVMATSTPPRRSGRPDEHVVVAMELDGGALAVVDAARSLPHGENALHVHGTGGSLCTGPLRWTSQFDATLHLADGTRRHITTPLADPLVAEVTAVRDAVAGQATPALATGADGLRGVAVLEAAVRSLDEDRRVSVTLPSTEETGG